MAKFALQDDSFFSRGIFVRHSLRLCAFASVAASDEAQNVKKEVDEVEVEI